MRSLRLARLAISGLGLALAAGASAPVLAQPATPLGTPPVTSNPNPGTVDPMALQALRRMSAYLATLPAAQLTSNTSLDVVTDDGQRVQVDGVVNYRFKRPAGFVIDVDTDGKQRSFYYNGSKFTVYAPQLGYYATADAPATNRATLDAIDAKYGIELPLEDLFRWNDATNNPAEDLTSGFVVGTATINGVRTDQYAFRQKDVDWQVWIQQGNQPLPLKVVIVDRTDPANPAYVARLTWNLSPGLRAEEFTYQPGKDAKPIRLSALEQ